MAYRLCDGYYLSLSKIRDDINEILAKDPVNTHEDVCEGLRDVSKELERVRQEIIADY